MNTTQKISWLDSCGQPSNIHATADGVETLCGGHAMYISNRRMIKSPKKEAGRSRFCIVCFRKMGTKKTIPWHPKVADAAELKGWRRGHD